MQYIYQMLAVALLAAAVGFVTVDTLGDVSMSMNNVSNSLQILTK